MSRWVLPHLFKVQANVVDWWTQARILGVQTPFAVPEADPGGVQFRWLLHPSLGLPRFPFVLWRRSDPGGALNVQELANEDAWEAVEFVGLPVDESWDDAYHGYLQGPASSPMIPTEGTLPAYDAATRRLRLGAPRIGWAPLQPAGAPPVPDWQLPDLEGYLDEVRSSRLLEGVHSMLAELPDGADQRGFVVDVADAGSLAIRPLHPAREPAERSTRGSWSPLGSLLLAAGTDPLAALALGFGTALNVDEEGLYMVTVQLRLTVDGTDIDFELADVTRVGRVPAPGVPTDCRAAVVTRSRPRSVDDSATDTIGVSWKRPDNPLFTTATAGPAAVSYAVGRFGPETWRADLLLTPRPEPLAGWLPFVATKPDLVQPVLFTEHFVRQTTLAGEPIADPRAFDASYAVAAQDVFGRWSPWATTDLHRAAEPPQTPVVLGVTVSPDTGVATVDLAWDWSDRSPELVEVVGEYADVAGTPEFRTTLSFRGQAEPSTDLGEVLPLGPSRNPANAWGADQDVDPREPGLRYYRLVTGIGLDFAGLPVRDFEVRARGQGHLDHTWGSRTMFDPEYNTSSWSSPVGTRLYDPAPPPPVHPEAPQWASLPGPAGISRAVLRWPAVPAATTYVVHEATETALRAAAGLPALSSGASYDSRIRDLQGAMAWTHRPVFRRIASTAASAYEATLPRGSRVIHVYAVTAVSANQVESSWPTSWPQLMAVAAPTQAALSRPTISAVPDPAGERVRLTVTIAEGDPVSSVEIYRVTQAALTTSVDTMGPPLATVTGAGPQLHHDDQPAPSWGPYVYRAVSWSEQDDLQGRLESRSPSSSAVSVTLSPTEAPRVLDAVFNAPGSNNRRCHVSWTSGAPIEATPHGSHTVVVEADGEDGTVLARLSQDLDRVEQTLDEVSLPGPDTEPVLALSGVTGGFRLHARIPRTPANGVVTVTIKLIDPFGRVGALSADVPVLPPVAVPDVLRRPVGEATATVRAAGLVPTVVQVALQDQDTAVVDTTDPPAGTLVEVGSAVTMVPADALLVPHVLGWPLQAGLDEVARVGLLPEEVHVALIDWNTAVVGQTDPPAGTATSPGAHVLVTPVDAG